MIRANGRSALILAAGLLAGAAPLHAGPENLNTPVFVAPAENGAQPNAAAQAPAQTELAAPNQLNDVDRSPHESAASPVASGDPASPRPAPAMAATGEHSLWNETSLIGKVFIGFGALLTIASAARMFMA